MKKNIPEIDDLLEGINDPDMDLGAESPKRQDTDAPSVEAAEPQDGDTENPTITNRRQEPPQAGTVSPMTDADKCWENFLSNLEVNDTRQDRDERLVCRLERDLADTLDDCDIHNRCRSGLVNAIVRAFFTAYLPKLAKYRRAKRSLFNNYKGE